MRGALAVSVGFHLLIALLMWVGLPRLDREPPAVERLKIIEMVDIAAVTNAPAKAAPRPDKPAPPPKPVAAKPPPAPAVAPPPPPPTKAPVRTPPPKEPVPKKTAAPKPAPPKPAPPKPTQTVAATPPAPPKPKAPRQPKAPKQPKPAVKPPPKAEKPPPPKAEKPPTVTAAVRPVARPKPPQPKPAATSPAPKPKTAPKPKVTVKTQVAPKPKAKKPPPSAFDKLLRSVAKMKPATPKPAVSDPAARKLPKEPPPQTAAAPIAAPDRRFDPDTKLSISELDAIRDQIADCWNIPAGAKGAEDLIVDIFVRMNPDGTVRAAEVKDSSRMRVDPFFRTAAESAIRALRNPRCSPLRLPLDKYDLWKTFTIGFNPRDMLG